MTRRAPGAGAAFPAVALAASLASAGAAGMPYVETPSLAERVATGELPGVEHRLPARPSVVPLAGDGLAPGRHGGELRLLMGRSKDVRLMVVYGYARLVGYDRDYRLAPDLLEGVEVEEERIFTLRLRPGHRWSDGRPFTSEDFRYYWEDIATNETLAPFGPPRAFLADGEPPRFEVLDARTVRYTWPRPNPFFLPALAGARPEPLYAPAHYLKAFHDRYTHVDDLEKRARKEGKRNWAAVHTSRFRPYKNTNPDLPTLQPWVNTTAPPSQRYVFARNPWYHRVDTNGRQLPYIDRVVVNISDGKLVPAKTGAGESDLQARHLTFNDYTFLKREREAQREAGAAVGDHPRRARRALPEPQRRGRRLARAAARRAVPPGALARHRPPRDQPGDLLRARHRRQRHRARAESAVRGGVPHALGQVRSRRRQRAARRDRAPRARRRRASGSWRTAGRWRSSSRPRARTPSRPTCWSWWAGPGGRPASSCSPSRCSARCSGTASSSGQTVVSVWSGLENGLPLPDMSPRDLAPTRQDQYQWPRMGAVLRDRGRVRRGPGAQPRPAELADLSRNWLSAPNTGARRAIWERMLEIRADSVFSIGIVSGVPQPVVVDARLRNVPEKGIYNWDPGAHFGIYRPDTFWFED